MSIWSCQCSALGPEGSLETSSRPSELQWRTICVRTCCDDVVARPADADWLTAGADDWKRQTYAHSSPPSTGEHDSVSVLWSWIVLEAPPVLGDVWSVVFDVCVCLWLSFESESLVNADTCPSMDGMTSAAGLVAMPTSHRRESFLYRSTAQQDMLMMTLKSEAATSREQWVTADIRHAAEHGFQFTVKTLLLLPVNLVLVSLFISRSLHVRPYPLNVNQRGIFRQKGGSVKVVSY